MLIVKAKRFQRARVLTKICAMEAAAKSVELAKSEVRIVNACSDIRLDNMKFAVLFETVQRRIVLRND